MSAPVDVITLPGKLRQNARGNLVEIVRAKLRLSEDLPKSKSETLDLTISDGTDTVAWQHRFTPIADVVTINRLALDHRLVNISGSCSDKSHESMTLGVFVDGVQSASAVVWIDNGKFSTQLSLSNNQLDGLVHLIEVRLLPEQVRLAFSYELLPCRITPWNALTAHAKQPLDITCSPAAAHHFRSLTAWAEALTEGAVDRSNAPPLRYLHDRLLAGLDNKADYRPLTFLQHSKPDVSIVIPVHNKFHITYFCLCSLLFAFNKTTFEVIIVDDGSSDDTLKLEELVEGVQVVRNPSPLGFVRACNAGAAKARGKYVAFLNNDTEVTAGWLDELVAAFDCFEDVGLVGSKLVYPNGKLQEAGGIVWRNGNPWNVGRNGNPADPAFNYIRQVDYISGAAVLLPFDLWETVGGFSDEFAPAYFEDTDLAMKVWNAGRRVLYVPMSTVFHYEGQSAGTSVASGMKRFQEVNRPKFKRKWTKLYASHGVEGQSPEKEKDRNVSFRVLFVDQRFPHIDEDAGSYAAFQEIRLLQALGGKVTFLPRNLAWMDRHTLALQRAGVECLYAPFVLSFVGYLEEHAADYDVVYITRYRVAQTIVEAIRRSSLNTKIIFNIADLHFLRELREAAVGTPGYSFDVADQTRDAELEMIRAADITLTYSEVEQAVIQSHMKGQIQLHRVPWVVEPKAEAKRDITATRDLLFLGGFGHPPNVHAVKYFIGEVLPALRDRVPDVHLRIVGSRAPTEITELSQDGVIFEGQLENLDEAFDKARIFVAPLLAGAGIKGKVLEAMARGMAIVLSPIAAEATGLTNNHSCIIARTPAEWVEGIARLYTDETLWQKLGANALEVARRDFSFEKGLVVMQDVVDALGVYDKEGLKYRHSRPPQYGFLV